MPHASRSAGYARLRTAAGATVRAAVLLGATAGLVAAQSASNVLLVVNTRSGASEQIGTYYARVRAIPQDNILRLSIDPAEEIDRAQFDRQVQAPIAKWFARQSAHDRILYIVLTKDVPLRVKGTSGRNGTVASVDSELTLLYRALEGRPTPPQGMVPNPYFLGDRPVAEARPFSHEAFDIFLVARLDGFTVADVLGLIDRGAAPVRTGRIALDEKFSVLSESGNRWLEHAAQLLQAMGQGDRVILDSSSRVIADETNILGYYSWGSNDPAFKNRQLNLGFVPGALAATYVSTDGRTFKEPPAEWKIGTWEARDSYFAGSPQSLAGDLIHEGATGVSGHVAEPYLDATIRPDVLFPAYLAGFNLAESFYLAMPYLSWQTVVVGDPLCAPFKQRALTAQEIDPGIDRTTEYPARFSARMLQALARGGTVTDAMRQMLRAGARLGKDDRVGAMQALEQATALDDRLTEAHFLLASLADAAGDYDKSIDRYRRVVALAPNHVLALNNLAYGLVANTRDGAAEALPLARRAHTLAPNEPTITDTLAWVLHIGGNDTEARPLMAAALRGAPDNAQLQLHAAAIDAALGATEQAARELARAIELDPALDKTKDAEDVRGAIAKAGKK